MKIPYNDIKNRVVVSETTKILYRKHKFFELLEEAVYNGLTPDRFRKENGLLNFSDLPYWEIHNHENFVVNPLEKDSGNEWFSTEGKENHLYFTFRKYATEDLLTHEGGQHIDDNTGLYCFIPQESGFSASKIDRHYGRHPQQIQKQNAEGPIKIYILEDEDDNIETIKKISPEIYKCLVAENAKEVKPSALPQMLFIAGDRDFRPSILDTNTIVCIDSYTNIGSYNGEIVLSGNFFMNRGSSVFKRINVMTVGKNVVIRRECHIVSSVIGDNVFIGEDVRAERYSKLMSGCFVNSNSTITEYQEILPAQQVSAKLPWIYDIFSTEGEFTYNRFLDLAKAKKESYLEKLENSQ